MGQSITFERILAEQHLKFIYVFLYVCMYACMYIFCITEKISTSYAYREIKVGHLDVEDLLSNHIPTLPIEESCTSFWESKNAENFCQTSLRAEQPSRIFHIA